MELSERDKATLVEVGEEIADLRKQNSELDEALFAARKLVFRAYDMGHHRAPFAETDSDLASLDAQFDNIFVKASEKTDHGRQILQPSLIGGRP